VTSGDPFVATLSDVFAQLGYGRDAQCGGGNCASLGIDEGVGGSRRVIRDGRRHDTLQDGGRDADIDRGRMEILRNESDGCPNLSRNSSCRHTLFFGLPDISLFPPFALQPFSVDLAKFLVDKSGDNRGIEIEVTSYIQSRCVQPLHFFRRAMEPGVQCLEADPDIFGFEKTPKVFPAALNNW